MSAVLDLCGRWDGFTKGQSMTTEQVRAAYASDMTDLIVLIESFRRQNPMNGDGSNYVLDQVLGAIAKGSPALTEAMQTALRDTRAKWNRQYVEFHCGQDQQHRGCGCPKDREVKVV